ncbi:MAG: hypothetical protein HKO07_00430, partial [Pseudomonadales bacterium]|nr:hypothetical protein [Pseudomonadales bacterium]
MSSEKNGALSASVVVGAALMLPMSGAAGEALVLRNYGLRFEAGRIREIAPYQ